MSDGVRITRRGVLRGAAGICALPSFVPASALGQGGAEAPGNRITMACIGVGGRGKENLRSFIGHSNCRIVAVCDVNANRVEEAKKIVNDHYGSADCAAYHDYRDVLARGDIDAVSIATPDAWHVLQSVEAARADKDIFLEKPLGLSVKDGIALRDAVRGYDRVFQFGTQQRSDRNFGFACELVQNGRIGKLRRIIVSVPASRAVGLVRCRRGWIGTCGAVRPAGGRTPLGSSAIAASGAISAISLSAGSRPGASITWTSPNGATTPMTPAPLRLRGPASSRRRAFTTVRQGGI
jgi:hypothetical protein